MPFRPHHFTVWMEIPVTDLEKAVSYYNVVFDAGLEIDHSGPNPIAMFKTKDEATGIAGHLYPGKPASVRSGPTVHIACPDKLEDTMKRVEGAGGEVVSGIVQIPAGRFVYTHDPDGNSIGVFEAA